MDARARPAAAASLRPPELGREEVEVVARLPLEVTVRSEITREGHRPRIDHLRPLPSPLLLLLSTNSL